MLPSRPSDSPAAPRFRQIVDVLRQQIVGGSVPEHSALPIERVIAEQHDVSRTVSLTAEAQASGAVLEIDVIEYEEILADAVLAPLLSIPVGERLFECTRLFKVGGHATFVETEQVIHAKNGAPFCAVRQNWRGELAEFSARAIVNPAGR